MNPTVILLSIGNELLQGSTVNTNASFLSRELFNSGFEVISQTVCADSHEAIRFRLGEAVRRADVVILTGGLGPTPDDVTREGVAAYFNVPLVFSEAQYRQMRKVYKRFGKRIPALVRREAFYPENAKPLINRYGIALGFSVEFQKKLIIALPGVPAELQNMYFDVVSPLLKRKFPDRKKNYRLIAKMVGISEPEVMKKLGKDFFSVPFDFGIYPMPGEVAIRIAADKARIFKGIEKKIRCRLKDWIYDWEEIPLCVTIGRLMVRKKQTLAVAESCTGGALAFQITRYPGASRFFKGGMVAYHRSVKEKIGVSRKILESFGEVSEKVALALAQQVRLRMEASYGIGITGIAGPEGGSPKKPVGLVYIALALPDGKAKAWKHVFWGNREQVQAKATVKALEYLWRKIR